MNLPSITHDQTTMDASRHQNIDALQQAAKYIERCLTRDNSAPTLCDHLGVSNPTNAIITSGLSDHDYPQLVGLPGTLATKTQLKTLLKVPLPVDIMKHFNHMQSHCTMGLFTEINRAWLTIDSDIYVWTYEEGGDVAYYDGLNQTILNVALIRPRAGVFQPFIKFLLVLTTAVDVIVLGVAFSGDDDEPYREIQLVSDPVFSVPTDGAIMTTVAGSVAGRLFLGSKDGSLYEITYQAESTWFGKRCKKINHSTSRLAFLVPSFAYTAWTDEDSIVQIVIDDTRNILYTLTERGCIEVYDMGVNGTLLSKVDRVTQNELVQQATNAVRTLDSQNFYPIVSISVVELTESQRINLVAVTQTGTRLYLTTTPALPPNSAPCRPARLALLHVRLPPGFSATAHFRPRNVRMAHHRDRNALMISGTNDKEVVWSIGSDLFAFCSMLMEAYTIVELDGPVLAMSEVKYNTNLLLQPTQQLPPLLVREHTEPPKKYVILTSQGAHILIKLRPVDVLKQLLLETRGTDNDAVRSYFAMQQEDQACASSLILATLDSVQNGDVADLATSAFFIFGGEPKLQQVQMGQATPYNSPGMFVPNMMSTPMSQYQMQNASLNPANTFSPTTQFQQQYSPNITMPAQTAQWYDLNSPFQYSSKHNGLYLHVGRILRPIWNLRCVEKVTVDGKKNYLMSTINADECLWILNDLTSLRAFLQRNTQLSCNNLAANAARSILQTPQPTKQAQSTRANFTLHDAQLDERQSLDALKSFVNHSAQILGLWKVLNDHQFHVLMDRLTDTDQQFLQNTAFKDIFLYGQDICACVINTLINNYLGDNASVDSISAKLREICPDLYKVEDAACSKANEILKVAKGLSNRDEIEEHIKQVLKLCMSVAPQINLKEICDQLTALKSYKAVIELTYTCAKRLDPENLALHFYKNSDNQESYVYYTRRMDIYKELTTMLDTVYNQNVTPQNSSTIMEDNMNLVKELIISILKYEDQLMHVAVYEWMMSKQLSNDIIKINQTTLETYLVKASQHNPNNIDILELLWKYYETNNNHAHAAKILNNLASINNPSVTLKDRVNYLTRALMCMRSSNIGYAPYLGAFLRDIENKLDVAKVQEKVLDALTAIRHQNPDIEIAISHLNLQLYEMTQLYEDFSDKFNLWECKLAIIDCSGYRDDNLIKNIWRNILQNEINRSGAVGNDRMLQILAKVKSLVKMYLESPCCIPLEYLMSELELIGAKLKADSSLVPSFFVSAGYSYEKLIEVYNALIVASIQDNFWLSEANEFRYSEAVATLLNSFINSHDNYNNVEKRRIIALGQDLVASLLSNLYSKPNSDRIVATLRGIQTRLTKL